MIFEIVQPCRQDSMAAECWCSRVFSWMCKLEIFIFLYCFSCSGLKADLSWTPFRLSVIMFRVYEVHISPYFFFFVFLLFIFWANVNRRATPLYWYPVTGPVTSYLQVFCFCEAATPGSGLYPLLAHSTVYGVSIQM